MTLDRYSEPYAPTGSIAAEGIRNLLGRPQLLPLELLTREALQNSWDARLSEGQPVEAYVDLIRLDGAARDLLADHILPEPPPGLPLADELTKEELILLVFADRGTCGLRGPLRANEGLSQERDFVDFVRNIGQPPDRQLGAGSFGYGKGSFYLLSKARTILAHTHCFLEDGTIQARFIACALGDHYTDQGGAPHTGRHWWGITNEGVIDPIVGREADALAAALGMRSFALGETGTTVAIIAPDLSLGASDDDVEPVDPAAAMTFIARAIAWNFWPKMLALRGEAPQMRFSVTNDAEVVAIPDPETDQRLALFATAMHAIAGDSDADRGLGGLEAAVWCQRPRQQIGQVAISRGMAPATGERFDMLPEAAHAMREAVHHTALMRQSELVVRYLDGPPLHVEGIGYAGVFKSDPRLHEAFRQAEPPTHDDWIPTLLERPYRQFVNVALRRVREIMTDFATPSARPQPGAGSMPLGEFSSQLANLIPMLSGPGAAIPAGPAPPAGAPPGTPGALPAPGRRRQTSAVASTARVDIVQPATTCERDGVIVIEMVVRVSPPDGRGATIRAVPSVLTLDGGVAEREPPLGAPPLMVLGWIGPDGTKHAADTISIREEGGEWTLHVSHLPDALVRIDLEVDAA
jgi:hypothetical protein